MPPRVTFQLQRLQAWLGRMPRDTALTLVGTLAGFMLGLATSHVYYLRSLSDTKADADERRKNEELLLRAVAEIGGLEYTRDAAGKVVGISIRLLGQASGSATASGSLSVVPAASSPTQ